MEKLSEEQLNAVSGWFAAGASLDEIQKRIKNEFGIHLTYLDVRLMVAELPQPEEPEPPKAKEPPVVDLEEESGKTAATGMPGEAHAGDEGLSSEADPAGAMPPEGYGAEPGADLPPAGEAAGELSVDVDPLAPPGCIACGSVTFSDGTAGKWMLDQMGRLGLSGLPQGYRPPPQDNAEFQPKLVAALRARGLV